VFSSANTIFLLGYTLSRTIRDFTPILNQRLAAGATIRVMILDPEIGGNLGYICGVVEKVERQVLP